MFFFFAFFMRIFVLIFNWFNLRGLTLQAGSKYMCMCVPESITLLAVPKPGGQI